MAWASMAASGVGPHVFIGDVTADRSSRMNSDMCRAVVSAHIQPNQTLYRWIVTQITATPKSFSRQRNRVYFESFT